MHFDVHISWFLQVARHLISGRQESTIIFLADEVAGLLLFCLLTLFFVSFVPYSLLALVFGYYFSMADETLPPVSLTPWTIHGSHDGWIPHWQHWIWYRPPWYSSGWVQLSLQARFYFLNSRGNAKPKVMAASIKQLIIILRGLHYNF